MKHFAQGASPQGPTKTNFTYSDLYTNNKRKVRNILHVEVLVRSLGLNCRKRHQKGERENKATNVGKTRRGREKENSFWGQKI